MSVKSPLFVSALELLAHATELYASKHPRNNKFVILHLANAVELILKDCLLDHGVSIYKNPNETITIWGGFGELAKLGIEIPEKPIIELLIDDRNNIQHRFGFPNAEAVYYYLEEVVSFFTRFLSEQYKVDLAEALEKHLSAGNLALLGLVKDRYSQFKKLILISPEAAIHQAYSAVEREIDQILYPSHSNRLVKMFLAELAHKGYLPEDIAQKYERLQYVSSRVIYGSSKDDPSVVWQAELETAIQILSAFDKAKQNGLITGPEENGPFSSLFRLSPFLAIEHAISAVETQLDRIRIMPRMRSSSMIDTSKGIYIGILDLLITNGYLSEDIKEKYQSLREARKIQDPSLLDENYDLQALLSMAEQIVVATNKARTKGIFSRSVTKIDETKKSDDQPETLGILDDPKTLMQA